MNTSYTYQSGHLTIFVNGHIDSSKIPAMQQEINEAIASCGEELTQLVIDADQMSFISSMGLRVMLQLKQKHETMRIINCAPEVYNVFAMTGFTKILTVEKALEQLSVEGLEPIPGMSDVYKLTDETMLKVFPSGTTKEDLDREVEISKAVFVLGIPTVMTFDAVKVGDRYGLIYETVIPAAIDADTRGELMRDLHEHIVEPGGLIPSAIATEKEQIRKLQPYLGDDAVAKFLQILSAIPDGSSLLYGNFTGDKALCRDGSPIMMDMHEVGYGNPVIDLAHFYSTLTEEQRGDFFDEVLDVYYDMEADETIARNRQNIVTLSMIRDFTRLVLNGEPTEEQAARARKDFEDRIAGNWEEILSRLHFKMDFSEEMRKLERKRFYLDSDVNIDWVANTLSTNRHYVSDYFNKVLHTTFNDYVNNLRLEYAAELIRLGRTPAAELPYAVGFNNDHTFRRLFKQKFGCTPSQYDPSLSVE